MSFETVSKPRIPEIEPAPIADQQRHMIGGLASELGWSASMLSRGLKHHFGVGSKAEIRTRQEAEAVIDWLKSERQRQCYQERHRFAFQRELARSGDRTA